MKEHMHLSNKSIKVKINQITRITPGQGLNRMRDEHHFLFSVHKHKKDLYQAMLLILPQPQLWQNKTVSQ